MTANDASSPVLAVDAMGGDLGPSEVIQGLHQAVARRVDFARLYLVGKPDVLTTGLQDAGLAQDDRIVIHPASQVISMEDKPIQALKTKKDASMIRAIELVREGEAHAAVSCGNTGALMACGTLRLRTLEGLAKPALATVIPSQNHFFILIDAGANPLAKAEDLVANAILGSLYAELVLGMEKPRVGLMSIGTEEGKGNDLTNATHPLLREMGDMIHYIGLVEGLQTFNREVDVVVCDGFTGNVLLKTCESLARMFKSMLREELTRTPLRKVGAALAKGAFRQVSDRMNPDRYGGAPLLGLRGNVLKAHGSANRDALFNAIRIASEVVSHRFIETARDRITVFRQRINAGNASTAVR